MTKRLTKVNHTV